MAGTLEVTGYAVQYQQPVSMKRYHELRAGMLDPWQILVLYQDMLEANCLPPERVSHAQHYLDLGLCRVPDQMVYH